MEILLFFLGPLLAFGLPVLLAVCSVVLGFISRPTAIDLVRFPLLIVVASAFVVPTSAQFTSTSQWPAPWWLAAMFGDFEYSGRVLMFISGVCLALFLLVVIVRVLYRATLGRRNNE